MTSSERSVAVSSPGRCQYRRVHTAFKSFRKTCEMIDAMLTLRHVLRERSCNGAWACTTVKQCQVWLLLDHLLKFRQHIASTVLRSSPCVVFDMIRLVSWNISIVIFLLISEFGHD